MAKKGTRKVGAKKNGKRGISITRRVFSPVGHVLNATGNSVKSVAKTAGNIVSSGLTGVRKVGNILVKHTNAAVTNITSKKSKKSK
jgi:hypothetical protein